MAQAASPQQAPRPPARPFVTVVMAVCDAAAHVDAALRAVADQTYPAESYEIVVAVGPSRDDTAARVRRAAAVDRRIRVVANPAGTASAGLNLAAAVARGSTIVRIDARTIVARDYIEQCVDALARSGADNVGGVMRATGHTPFGRAAALAMQSWLGSGGARFRISNEEELVDTVYLGAWRRDALTRAGGFDETLARNQDDELNMRIRRNGGRVLLTPRIQSIYVARDTARALWRQYFDYGVWKVAVLRKHADSDRPMWEWRHVVPAAFLAACLAGALVPALVHLTAGAMVALRTNADWRTRVRMPAALLIMPLAYGAGSFAGLYQAWRGRIPLRAEAAPSTAASRARRLDTVYQRYRRREARHPKWHDANAGNRAMRGELAAAISRALASAAFGPVDALRVLDVGVGRGATSLQLRRLGVNPRNLFGVDLLEQRLAAAQEALPGVSLQRADAVAGLPYVDHAFDVVCAFTLFSSIQRGDERREAAREIGRVVRPGGAILLYDLRVPNPFNRRVRHLSRAAVAALWPGFTMLGAQSLTLLPPLARRLPPHRSSWYTALARIAPLRTHTFVVLEKPASAAPDAA